MKKLFRYFVFLLSKNKGVLKKLIKSTSLINRNLYRSYQEKLYALKHAKIPEYIFSEKKVLNGPFKGMLYPDFFFSRKYLISKTLR